MLELDKHYLSKMVNDFQRGRREAFAELFTATYQKQYRTILSYIPNRSHARILIRDIYCYVFQNLNTLNYAGLFLSWLDEITERMCDEYVQAHSDEEIYKYDILEKSPRLNNPNCLLQEIYVKCNCAPNVIPVEMLEAWGNYTQNKYRFERIVCVLFLVLMAILPVFFIHPSIQAEKAASDSTVSADYEIKIRNLLPLESVTAALNGENVELTKISSKQYKASFSTNGTLVISVTSMNGQSEQKEYDITFIDTEKPKLISYYTNEGKVYIVVLDTYSGVDYDNVVATDTNHNWVEPLSIDEENSTLIFQIPTEKVSVQIPDFSGNTLSLSITPDEGE